MKKIIIGLLLILTKTAYGQFKLEHEYNSHIESIVLENSGLKYYSLNIIDKNLIIYNTDHTIWKNIILPTTPSISDPDIWINDISETKINSDNKVEVIYTHRRTDYNEDYIDEIRIINEDEQVLWSKNTDLSTNITLIEQNIGNKLLVSSTSSNNIYSLPDFTLEHEYGSQITSSIVLENSGQKYYLSDVSTKQIKIYNSDHTIWKTITLPIPSYLSLMAVVHLSESKINPDSHLEIGYIVYHSAQNQYELKIANEEGFILLDLPAPYNISDIEKQSNKLILTPSILGSSPYKSIVYTLPDLTLEHEYAHNNYSGLVIRKKLETSGEKFYVGEEQQIKIYNSDHTLWKTIDVTLPPDAMLIDINHISENVLNNNSNIELILSYYDFQSDDINSLIIDDTGTIRLTTNGNLRLIVNPDVEAPNKLIASSYMHGNSIVYSVSDITTNIDTPSQTISTKIVPNPTSDFIKISMDTLVPFNQITIYDQNGKNVLDLENYNNSPIDVSFLPKGLYFLLGKEKDQLLFKSKFIVY
jgi:hypothetical protein